MKRLYFVSIMALCLLISSIVEARPRSGSSFSGRSGFRSSSGSSGSSSRSYSSGRTNYGGGSSFVFLPSFGWGMGGFGMGGGCGSLGTLMILGIVGISVVSIVRSMRRASRRSGSELVWGNGGDEGEVESLERSYVHKLQLAIGRSGREIQSKLAGFAASGDTSSQEGLAELLRQTVLELNRQKDSIRYAGVESSGPFNLTNGETKLSSLAMAERSHFQVERIRGAEGKVHKSESGAVVGAEVLEFIVVTVLVATRSPLAEKSEIKGREDLGPVLSAFGSVPGHALLGLEVIWMPADEEDTLTETDVMTTYPELRSI